MIQKLQVLWGLPWAENVRNKHFCSGLRVQGMNKKVKLLKNSELSTGHCQLHRVVESPA